MADKGREMKRNKGRKSSFCEFKNLLIWAVFAEILCIQAICLMIAACLEGKPMMILLLVSSICSLWLAIFIQTNADIFDKRIRRFERKVIAVFRSIKKRIAVREQPPKRKLTIYTFPKS